MLRAGLGYYGGDGEYAAGTAVFGSRLKKGARAWTKPAKIASHPFRSLGNAVVWLFDPVQGCGDSA